MAALANTGGALTILSVVDTAKSDSEARWGPGDVRAGLGKGLAPRMYGVVRQVPAHDYAIPSQCPECLRRSLRQRFESMKHCVRESMKRCAHGTWSGADHMVCGPHNSGCTSPLYLRSCSESADVWMAVWKRVRTSGLVQVGIPTSASLLFATRVVDNPVS